MNIIEAINSGRRMKTEMIDVAGWRLDRGFMHRQEVLDLMKAAPMDGQLRMLNANWEVEEKKVEVTESQLKKAWDKCIVATGPEAAKADFKEFKFANLCKELGLKD